MRDAGDETLHYLQLKTYFKNSSTSKTIVRL